MTKFYKVITVAATGPGIFVSSQNVYQPETITATPPDGMNVYYAVDGGLRPPSNSAVDVKIDRLQQIRDARAKMQVAIAGFKEDMKNLIQQAADDRDASIGAAELQKKEDIATAETRKAKLKEIADSLVPLNLLQERLDDAQQAFDKAKQDFDSAQNSFDEGKKKIDSRFQSNLDEAQTDFKDSVKMAREDFQSKRTIYREEFKEQKTGERELFTAALETIKSSNIECRPPLPEYTSM